MRMHCVSVSVWNALGGLCTAIGTSQRAVLTIMSGAAPPLARKCLDCSAELAGKVRKDVIVCASCTKGRNACRTAWNKTYRSTLGAFPNET